MRARIRNKLSLLWLDEELFEEEMSRSPLYFVSILAITNIIVLKLIFLVM